jgi:hypothetical protein
MNCIVKYDRGNNYRLPHLNKKLENEGMFPRSILLRSFIRFL